VSSELFRKQPARDVLQARVLKRLVPRSTIFGLLLVTVANCIYPSASRGTRAFFFKRELGRFFASIFLECL